MYVSMMNLVNMVLYDTTIINKFMSEANDPDFMKSGYMFIYGMAIVFPAIYIFYMLCVTQRYANMKVYTALEPENRLKIIEK